VTVCAGGNNEMKFVKLNNVSLKKKLIAIYLIVSILPIMSLGYFLTSQLYESTLSHDISLTISSHKQLQDNLLGVFRSNSGVLEGLLRDPRVMDYVETYYEEDYMAILDFTTYISPVIRRTQMDHINTYIRIYSDNKAIAHSEETGNSMQDLYEESWYNGQSYTATSRLSWVVTDRINKGNPAKYIGCFRELKNIKTNTINRVFAVFFDESQLYSLISQEQESGKVIFLVNEKGQIVTSTERSMILENISELAGSFSSNFDDIENNTYTNFNGQHYSVIRTTFSKSNLAIKNWTLVTLIPAQNLQATVSKIWFTSIGLSLVCIVFSLILVLWVSNNIAERAKRLIRKMNQVISSNYNIKIFSSGSDEIGSIEQHFSDLVQKTGELINEVLIANLKIKDSEINYQKLQTEKREAEIIALQEQINPHYLFNTLETIRMNLIIENDRKNAEIVGLFAEGFRVAINRDRDYFSLAEELDFVRTYFKIQVYRFRGNISLIIDVPEQLLCVHIPRLLVQPLVENAVYHGIEMKGEPGTIRIAAYQQENDLCIKVSDDGVGISESDLKMIMDTLHDQKPREADRLHSRIALRNIHQRLILMYGETYGLQIESVLNKGTQVLIRIPINENLPLIEADNGGDADNV